VARLAARGGGILLMHDIKPRTAAVVPRLLAMLKARGLRIVHVVPRGGGTPAGLIARSQHPAPSTGHHSPNVASSEVASGRKSVIAPPSARPVLAKNNFESVFTPVAQRR
jgi:peptidoglycan-N-acetylglucosamine deacetylase